MLANFLLRLGVACRIRGLLLKEAEYLTAHSRLPANITVIDILRWPQRAELPIRLARFVNPSDPVHLIDIGANNGNWASQFLASFQFASAELWEPLPDLAKGLQQRFANDARVRVVSAAASATSGQSTIFMPQHSAMASLHEYSEFIAASPLHGNAHAINITTRRIDEEDRNLVGRKVVLKVDAQGHELEVLAGASQTLKTVDIAIVEASLGQVFKGIRPTFADVCTEMARHNLMPCMFPSAGTMFGNHPVEQDIIFVRFSDLPELSRV